MDILTILAKAISLLGALSFGLVIGWLTYRTIRRTKDDASLQDIPSIIAALGGATILSLFKVGEMFGMYSIGLAIGFFCYYWAVKKNLSENENPTDVNLLGGP